jgi:hypothetical protein
VETSRHTADNHKLDAVIDKDLADRGP